MRRDDTIDLIKKLLIVIKLLILFISITIAEILIITILLWKMNPK